MKKIYCRVTVSDWKSVHMRLDDLENFMKELKSKSGNEPHSIHAVVDNSGPSSKFQIDQVVEEPLSLDADVTNTSHSNVVASASSSLKAIQKDVSSLAPPTSSPLASLKPIDIRNAIKKSRRVVISLKRYDEVEVLAQRSKNEQTKKNNSTANTVKRIYRPRVAKNRKAAASASHEKRAGQNEFEQSRRAVISLKKCAEVEVFAGKPSVGSKKKQSKKCSPKADGVKRSIRSPRVTRKSASSLSQGKSNGKCSGSGQSGVRGGKRFSCNLCPKRLVGKSALRVHSRTHKRERPHTCWLCPKSFNSITDLTRHVRVHTGEKPFQCSLCSRCFSQRSSLTRHISTHTGEKP